MFRQVPPSVFALFDAGRFQAELCRTNGADVAAWTAADDDHVVLVGNVTGWLRRGDWSRSRLRRTGSGRRRRACGGICLRSFHHRAKNGAHGYFRADIRQNRANGDRDTWSTVGVSGNVIDASFQALVEGIVYRLVELGIPAQ